MNKRNIKDMTLRERFDARGFSPAAYAKAYGVERVVLYGIFSGRVTGVKKSHKKDSTSGDVRRVIAQLKKDKVWIGKLPWEG
jgi:hypothetical protein